MADYETITAETDAQGKSGVTLITLNRPKALNALNSQVLEDLIEAFAAYQADETQLCAVLTGSGEKAFAAGADIKEMSEKEAADFYLQDFFAPWTSEIVKKTRKPWIAAVNGFCVGGGVGLVGNADCIVASDDAYFGVPEVNQGALGAATHMARLVPPHMLRTLYFTARTIKAVDLVQFGSVLETVPREELMDAALRVATDIASKDTRVIRAAKEALNGIDPVDVNKSYRFCLLYTSPSPRDS